VISSLADRSDDHAQDAHPSDALDLALRRQAAQVLFALSYSWPMSSTSGMFVRHVASLLETMDADAAILRAEQDLRAVAEQMEEAGIR